MLNKFIPERIIIITGQMANIEHARVCEYIGHTVYCTEEACCEVCEIRKIAEELKGVKP